MLAVKNGIKGIENEEVEFNEPCVFEESRSEQILACGISRLTGVVEGVSAVIGQLRVWGSWSRSTANLTHITTTFQSFISSLKQLTLFQSPDGIFHAELDISPYHFSCNVITVSSISRRD